MNDRSNYRSDDYISGGDRSEETGKIRQAIGEGHQYTSEPRRDVQVVNLESRIDATVQTHADGQDHHRQPGIAASERGGD